MKRNIYVIKIRREKAESEAFITTMIDNGYSETSKRTDTKEEVIRFLKKELVI